MKNSSTLLTAILLVVAWGCKKNNQRDFPRVEVREYIYINNPSNNILRSVGGSVTAQGGYRGLIVYRRYANRGNDDFAAYDQACPEHYDRECSQLEIGDDGNFAVCPCENEKYLLFDGSPGDSASTSLFEYRTNFDGEVIFVSDR